MKVLVIGSNGNMGRRYISILKYLSHDYIECDLFNSREIQKKPLKVDKAIICTPVASHFEWCEWCIEKRIPFLCEKPITKDIDSVKFIAEMCKKFNVDGRMVCNWLYVTGSKQFSTYICFDYYNTGRDGIWDLIQPVYISEIFEFNNISPIFKCTIGLCSKLTQLDFDKSYLIMIDKFINNSEELLDMNDAVKATKKIIEWGKNNEKFFSNNPS